MTPPAEAFRRLLTALALGGGLGFIYGALRPLRRRRSWPADLVFLFFTAWAWLYLSFAICGGDLRPGWLGGLGLGAVIWDTTAGRLLRPVFCLFWDTLRKILSFPLGLVKKILKNAENLQKNSFQS